MSKVHEYKNFYKESYVSWLILLSQDGPEEKQEPQSTDACLIPCPWVPEPEDSIFLIKSILCSRTYNASIDPSINTQQSLATESPPPSCLLYPWLDQPTFSAVTLFYSDKHNFIIHTVHSILFAWKIFSLHLTFTWMLTRFIDKDEINCPRSHSINLNQDMNQVSYNSVVPVSQVHLKFY